MIEEPYTLGKIGAIAEKLEDIRDFIHKKFVLFPIDQIQLISEAIVNSNKKFLKIYFTLGYFGVKNQLEENYKEDLIAQMNNFMQWSRVEIRNQVRIMKLLNLGQFFAQNNEIRAAMNSNEQILKLDPNNRIALIAMAGLCKAMGDVIQSSHYLEKYQYVKAHPVKVSISRNPQEEFEGMIDKLEEGQKIIESTKNRDFYKKICSESHGILEIIMDSIAFVGKSFDDKNSVTTIRELQIIINDLLYFLSEWLVHVSGAVYYIMKHGYGTPEQIELVLNALKEIIGFESHKNIEEIDKAIFVEYEKQKELNEIQRLEEESMRATRLRHQDYGDLIKIDFRYKHKGVLDFFHVIDYEREDLRKKMIKSKEIILKSKKIRIVFAYPLTNMVSFEYENKKGFTRMDLFNHIYEGYKKIYMEEENEVGDPGTWKYAINRARSYGKYGIWNHYLGDLLIESVFYSPSRKTIEMFIGS